MTTFITKPAARAGRDEQPEYRLACEPDGRSWTARENLADILERELLGPANGPRELLGGSPDAAYLVGRIAPARPAAGRDDPTAADDPEAATDVGDAVDADEGRGVPGHRRRRCHRVRRRGLRRGHPPAAGADDPRVDGAALPDPH